MANVFNPSVVSHVWLVRTGLLGEDELPHNSGSIFTDALVQVVAPRYTLIVTPENLQFVPSPREAKPEQLIAEKVGRLVETLPHTPFRAIGLNFTWHAKPEDDDGVRRLARRLFFREESPLYREFSSSDCQYGAYLSKDTLGFRLKLDIRPITSHLRDGVTEQFLQMLFNYHADIGPGEDAVARIGELLGRWQDASNEAQRLVGLILDRGEA
ncbi:MAG: hypothetical protein U0871_01395 [Gemmataceae bacterium]